MKVPTLESRTRRALGKRWAYVVRVTAAGPDSEILLPCGREKLPNVMPGARDRAVGSPTFCDFIIDLELAVNRPRK